MFPAITKPLLWICLGLCACRAPKDPVQTSIRQTFVFDEAPQVSTLGPGDLVFITVMGHPELSTRPNGTRVDRDGQLHLPLIGSVAMQGIGLQEARGVLETSFAEFVREPVVSIDLLENQSNRYYILGHVHEPGAKPLDRSMTALEATSTGGYFLRGADRKNVFVLRPHADGLESHRIDISRPGPESLVRIRSGDVIFVRQTGVDNFQEDWLPILSSLGITALTLSQDGVLD